MTEEPSEIGELLRRAATGDQDSLADAFNRFRSRLKRTVQLRLDRRLEGRVDPSDRR